MHSGHIGPALLCGFALAVAAPGFGQADEPLDETAKAPVCCGVPPRDEVTADHVFGRWVVTQPGVGTALKAGEHIEFRRDGTLATSKGPCRFAVLRAELTVICADKTQSGEVRIVDDTKLIWRLEGKDTLLIAPTD